MISKNKLKKTKIIATIGPASNSYEIIKKMILNGVNLCRINFSHTNHEDALNIVYLVNKINNEIGTRAAILGDLQGPKLRIGLVKKNTILKTSSKIHLTNKSCVSSEKKIFVNYPRLIKDLNINDKVLIDDGKIKLRVLTINKSNITCEVINGGPISSKKGVNLPTSKLSLKSITKKDRKDLNFLIKNKIEWVALSFVQSAKDIIDLRKIINAKKSAIKIIAKIEKPQAIKNIKSITRSSDAVMIARGDLGIEIPMQKVPIFQKKIITLCLNYSKPVVVATQLMEGMINNPITTRAETNDVANAVFDGADALMLSGETAIGKNPIKVVKAMSKIILSVENSDFELKSKVLPPKKKSNSRYISDSICLYACKLADQTQAKAIITLTASGYNAQKICSNRPKSFIYVFTHNKQILNTLSLLRGVYTFYYTKFNSTDETIKDLHKFLIKWKFIKKGDTVINIGSMPVKEKGMTNMLKLNTVN
tara:strand:- start:580 stop:2016 length:1437 start_codon:yes stop_codon:yes gene_type:complete